MTPEQKAAIKAGTHYQCAACGGFFEKGTSDEEAKAESRKLWGDLPPEALVIICDDCFQKGQNAS